MREFNLFIGLVLFTVCLSISVGCETGTAETESASGLPKLKFHKPADFPTAVARMGEIMDAIESDQAELETKTFKVLEVVHGTGSSAHSHFYLADSDEEHDDHGHETSEEKTHDVEVDMFTELVDIVRWLPDVAGDSDMNQANWNKVTDGSSSLGNILKRTTGASHEETRGKIQSESKIIRELLSELKSIADGNDAKN